MTNLTGTDGEKKNENVGDSMKPADYNHDCCRMKNLADTHSEKKNQNVGESTEEVGEDQDDQYSKYVDDENSVVSWNRIKAGNQNSERKDK